LCEEIPVKGFEFVMILIAVLTLMFLTPAYSASLNLTVVTDKQVYNVGSTAVFTGGVNNGSVVPNALVLVEVDNPLGNPWIIRTFTTGQAPAGPFYVQLVNVTPTDAYGDPDYSFNPGNLAGFLVYIENNGGSAYPVVVSLNLFYSNGLPFYESILFNETLQAGQTVSALGTVPIPVNAVAGQAMVYASVFNKYPKSDGFAYSPGQSAAFNITSGVPAQVSQSSPLGNFSFLVPFTSTASLPIRLGNYTAYATTQYGYYYTSAQTMFTLQLIGDFLGNGKIDIRDVHIVALAYGSYGPNYFYPGSPASSNWNPAACLTGPNGVPDNRVDIRDVNLVAKEYGVVAIPAP
jgi:hypothetical protein